MKAVFCGVEMKLHRLLLTGCMNCTRVYLPFTGKFYSKRLLSSVSPCSSRMDGTRSMMLWTARAALYPVKCTVPLGTRKRRLYSKSCSDVGSKALCCHTSHVSRCPPRRCPSAAERNEKLLGASATWPGENTGNLKKDLILQQNSDISDTCCCLCCLLLTVCHMLIAADIQANYLIIDIFLLMHVFCG